ncbi:MAG: hypothetical protein ACLR23_24080 [Clostridia bacterium]
MMEGVDFTDCRKILGRAYNGANGKKIAIEYGGSQYMLKFSPSGGENPQRCPIPIAVSASISPAASSIFWV